MSELATAALEALGIPWEREGGGIALTQRAGGRCVPVRMQVRGERVTLYAVVRRMEDAKLAALWCNGQNRTLGEGCLVADAQGRVFLKMTAHLMDELLAAECMQCALGRFETLLGRYARQG